nr:MAG: helix-turn-helix domain protein [Bacteriophage sp.]UWI29255.1 MAG: helix-turn-helix domain protein [Bacteriophage sp.]
MKLYTHEEMLDSVIGVKGTPRRDEYEAKVDAFLIGEAIKQARESRNITQEQLGEMIGVKKAQISRIEKGSNLTIQTIRKVFCAMGMSINLEIVGLGKFAI